LCRNIQRRRTLAWPIFPGVVLEVAAGERFAVHASDFALVPGLGDAFAVLVKECMVEIEETGLVPVLH
jgi:hypothetical protein